MNNSVAFQDQIGHNHCFGCGPNNQHGLRIKSYWGEKGKAVCEFIPQAYHSAAPTKFVNGGIISTIIDCHCVCSAMAMAYKVESKKIGSGKAIYFATGNLEVSFRRPVPISNPILLSARFKSIGEKKIVVECELISDSKVCVTANVIAVRVPDEWMS